MLLRLWYLIYPRKSIKYHGMYGIFKIFILKYAYLIVLAEFLSLPDKLFGQLRVAQPYIEKPTPSRKLQKFLLVFILVIKLLRNMIVQTTNIPSRNTGIKR